MRIERVLILVARTSAVATGLIGLLEIVRISTGFVLIPEPIPGTLMMRPWVAWMLLFLSTALIGLPARKERERRITAAFAGTVLLLGLASIACRFAFQPGVNAVASGLRATRPIGAVTLCLGSSMILLCLWRRTRVASNVIALLVQTIGGSFALYQIYGDPFFQSHHWPAVSFASSLAAIAVGTSVIAANGVETWPTRLFSGFS